MSDEPESTNIEPPEMLLGTVAIVGFPNVGKSTLVNRLTSSRAAVVHETEGTTRDRKELICEWAGKRFLLIDTGGVDLTGEDQLTRSIADQAKSAIEEADLVLFLVDARAGITPGDEDLATILRASKKHTIVIANKIDDPSQEHLMATFHRFGLGDPFPLSGLHGHGSGDLLDLVVETLEDEAHGRPAPDDGAIRVAILGWPNVGKSSLFNALIGEERTIVSDVPGTTLDSIDTIIERDGRTFILVDTAGLRRKRKQRQGIDYYSELRALEAADRADIALILIDYAQRVRLKVLGRLAVREMALSDELAQTLVDSTYRARPQRAMVIRVEGFDWNCPQHIPVRIDAEDVQRALDQRDARIAELEARLAQRAADPPASG